MKFPWSKPKRNTEGGPPTALFAFDRARERQMAERYAHDRPDLLEARYRLIDAVLDYRRDRVLTPALLEACEKEYEAAPWPYSEGVRRLVELAQDGHPEPAARVETMLSSKDWRERYEALVTSFERTKDPTMQTALVRRGLADRSGRIRSKMAGEAVFAHLIDLADDIEDGARLDPKDDVANALFTASWFLRRNARAGSHGVYGGGPDEAVAMEEAWRRLRDARMKRDAESAP